MSKLLQNDESLCGHCTNERRVFPIQNPIFGTVVKFLWCTCANNYENWLAEDEVIAKQEYVRWNAVSVPLLQFARYCCRGHVTLVTPTSETFVRGHVGTIPWNTPGKFEVVSSAVLVLRHLIRGYHTAVFISTRISRSSVDYQPEAIAEG